MREISLTRGYVALVDDGEFVTTKLSPKKTKENQR